MVAPSPRERLSTRTQTRASARRQRELYVAPTEPDAERPARRLVGFAGVAAGPGQNVEDVVELPRRAFEIWDEMTNSWSFVKGSYEIQAGRSIADRRITLTTTV